MLCAGWPESSTFKVKAKAPGLAGRPASRPSGRERDSFGKIATGHAPDVGWNAAAWHAEECEIPRLRRAGAELRPPRRVGEPARQRRPQKQIRIATSRTILVKFIPVRLILRWARRKRTAICPIVCRALCLASYSSGLLVCLKSGRRSGAGFSFISKQKTNNARRGRGLRANLESCPL